MDTQLWINIDHVATLREARNTVYPDIATAIAEAEAGGAAGITMHLREDRRHIQDLDLSTAKQYIQTHLNMEMAATDEMTAIACQIEPSECCIVPEKRAELTTEGGLDVKAQFARIANVCQTLNRAGIKVSLFIEPTQSAIDKSIEAGAQIVELHTGQYALAGADQQDRMAEQIAKMAGYAATLGLQVNAGHGLHRDNVKAIAAIPQITALNIGHAVVSDAVFMGLKNAVIAMRRAMQ